MKEFFRELFFRILGQLLGIIILLIFIGFSSIVAPKATEQFVRFLWETIKTITPYKGVIFQKFFRILIFFRFYYVV